ncbi:SDR family NAD(P)-dependent oxidoreductase [Gryllotalpicola protaetiae]|uniref:SDR family oxidoreductase n=1 Tax=Gryllotalpicola protaetiae TaxID=2419771 RepID=A0A387BPG6_9MICO|nr:SDR family NAD(P)-dependent oxidoreductase [Gryllotalpicola protaetiae]AYG03944.1 SDR family oxidoreductase [Gryllotalpicola protaetiae]
MSTAQLAGKTALVTGATSGIGRAAAVRLAEQGAEVLVHGRDAARGAAVVEDIETSGGKARFVQADLANPEEIEALAEKIGDVDILVNNAGTVWFGPTPDISVAEYDNLFNANVRATYLVTAALIPGLVRKGGAVVNVGSMAGKIGMSGGAAYGATKAALHSFTQAWAAELAPQGVRVNAVAPGPIFTPIVSDESTSALGSRTPLARGGKPEEIADTIAFLVSPAAGYVTGAVLSADGGYTAV